MHIFKDPRKREYLNPEVMDNPLKSPVPKGILEDARAWRKNRMIETLNKEHCGAILLYDPVNIRYALDVSNMQVWSKNNPWHYALLFADGYAVDFSGERFEALTGRLGTVQETRTSTSWFYFLAGDRGRERASSWADELISVLRERGAHKVPLAVDKLDPMGLDALRSRGVEVVEGQQVTEHARSIKNESELHLIRWTLRVAEAGMARMYQASLPGKTEQEIWAELHYENIRSGGEWIETRLCTAGPRTNPWFNECSDYVCQEGDMLAFDTDMIGPYGYCADLSRSWTIGHVPLQPQQKMLYSAALDQIQHNLSLLKSGLTFTEFNDRSWKIPGKYLANRYGAAVHGVGMADEYPVVPTHPGFDSAYQGIFEENMVVCVESLVGEEGGRECVKLETQVLIGRDGATRLDTFPFEEFR